MHTLFTYPITYKTKLKLDKEVGGGFAEGMELRFGCTSVIAYIMAYMNTYVTAYVIAYVIA